MIFLLTFFETIGVALYELFVVTVVKHNLPPTADMVFKMAISKVIVIWLYQVGKNTCLTKKQFEHAPKKQLFLYCLLTFFSIINICLNAKINHSTESNIDRFFGYFSIIIVVLVNLYIMKLFDYIIENEKLKNRISLSEQQANLKLKYYKKLDANYQKSLQTLHDVDKHINTLEHLYKSNDFERANRYLESINKLISGFILIPYTTNTVLNIILNEKQVEAQKKDIIFKCSIDNIDFDFMDDIDITTIFSNLIDNAITASATCKALKQIILNVSSHNNFVVINIKNNYTQIIQNEPFSEKHYGIGLYNVENSLKKYEGSLKITCSKNDFECNVVLSNTH